MANNLYETNVMQARGAARCRKQPARRRSCSAIILTIDIIARFITIAMAVAVILIAGLSGFAVDFIILYPLVAAGIVPCCIMLVVNYCLLLPSKQTKPTTKTACWTITADAIALTIFIVATGLSGFRFAKLGNTPASGVIILLSFVDVLQGCVLILYCVFVCCIPSGQRFTILTPEGGTIDPRISSCHNIGSTNPSIISPSTSLRQPSANNSPSGSIRSPISDLPSPYTARGKQVESYSSQISPNAPYTVELSMQEANAHEIDSLSANTIRVELPADFQSSQQTGPIRRELIHSEANSPPPYER